MQNLGKMTNHEKNRSGTQSFSIDGMTCQGCVNQVKTALQNSGGISTAVVSLEPPIAKVTFADDNVPIVEMQKLLPSKYSLEMLPDDRLVALANNANETNANFVQIGGESKSNESKKTKTELPSQVASRNLKTYWPLILIVGYILGGTFIAMAVAGNWNQSFGMRLFMGLFFVVFSFFKLLDLSGFANAYRSYDWIAKKIPQYGSVYPLIELTLGIGYLMGFNLLLVNWVTLIVMVVSIAGVVDAVVRQKAIQCACLGTGFNLPMSTVTIIEDGTMILMAAIMIWNLS